MNKAVQPGVPSTDEDGKKMSLSGGKLTTRTKFYSTTRRRWSTKTN